MSKKKYEVIKKILGEPSEQLLFVGTKEDAESLKAKLDEHHSYDVLVMIKVKEHKKPLYASIEEYEQEHQIKKNKQ